MSYVTSGGPFRPWRLTRTVGIATVLCALSALSLPTSAGALGDPPAIGDLQRVIVTVTPGANPVTVARAVVDPTLVFNQVIHGFAATMSAVQRDRMRTDPAVMSITPDRPVHLAGSGTQTSPPWHLDRLDQAALPLDTTLVYPASGASVTAYIVDTGLRASHIQFSGRVRAGYSTVLDGRGTDDCHGHGTHVTGLFAGATSGLAKAATIVPLRALDCNGGGYVSDVIATMDWAVGDHPSNVPAVMNMSIGAALDTTLNDAVAATIADGITVVVAAGNDNRDACLTSPAAAPGALTVAATDATDTRATFSNFGTCVDLFAPGVALTSAAITSDTATTVMSGTSMASPVAAGAAAGYLERNPSATPAQVATALSNAALAGVVRQPGTGSPDRFLSLLGLATPPAPPGSVACAPTASAATVTWSVPDHNGAPITGYQVSAAPTSGTPVSATVPASTTSAQLNGLTSAITYAVTVTASNRVGTSAPSASLACTPTATPTPATSPAAPSALRATPAAGAVNLAWDPPPDGGSALSSYDLRYGPDATLTTTTVLRAVPVTAIATPSYSVTGLSNGTAYFFQVRACNALGCGPWGPASPTSATPSPPPGPPTTLLTAVPTQGTVALSWSPPPNPPAPITDYRVEISDSGGTWTAVPDPVSTAPSATVTGLDPTHAYLFRVSALNTTGASTPALSGPTATAVAPGPLGHDIAYATVALPGGGALVAGYFTVSVDFPGASPGATLVAAGARDAFVAKVRPDGTWAWAARAGGSGDDVAYSLALLPGSTSALVAGYFSTTAAFAPLTLTSAGGADAFVATIDTGASPGTWQQALRAGGTGPDAAYGVAAPSAPTSSSAPRAAVAGVFSSRADFGATSLTAAGGADAFVATLSSSLGWAGAVRAGSGGDDAATAIAARADGSLVAAGYFSASADFTTTTLAAAGASDAFVATLTPSGTWTGALGAGGSDADAAWGLALAPDGTSAIVTGYFSATAAFAGASPSTATAAGGTDGFAARASLSAAAPAWSRLATVASSGNDVALGVEIGADGAALVSGYATGPVQLTNAATIAATGAEDGFVARLDPAASWSWAVPVASSGPDVIYDVTLLADGRPAPAGFVSPAATVAGTLPVASAGGADIFTAALSPPVNPVIPPPTTSIAPTPPPATAPADPSALTATPAVQSMALSWPEPASNGATITSYDLRYSTASSMSAPVLRSGLTTTSATVASLAATTTYYFQVRATNAAGTSAWGPATPVAARPLGAPSAPTPLTATAGLQAVSLSWTPPAAAYKVTSYDLRYSTASSMSSPVLRSGLTTASATVSALSAGKTYYFQVRATNAAGTSAWGPTTPVAAVPGGLPAAPSSLSATAAVGAAALSWAAAASNGAPITDYVIQYSLDGTTWKTFTDPVSTATTARVSPLTSKVRYWFRVAATNAYGTGSYSRSVATTVS